MAPFDLSGLGPVGSALVFGAIGVGFGAALELAGFGDTRKLAAQFYLRELTVLKVMFTAIVVAAVLVAGAVSLGLLDMSRVWVNPTFLWSELAGGLIMGVGFVLGGFCPGTSLVAAATFKVDGVVFVLGGLFGVWLFGESVGAYEPFWLSGDLGRFTLQDWLGLSTGAVVLGVVALALLAFWGAEWLERRFGVPGLAASVRGAKLQLAGAAVLGAAALLLAVRGEPTTEQRWAWAPHPVHQLLAGRGAFISPAEVVALRKDTTLSVQVLDLRDEHAFNLFHVGGARRVAPEALQRAELRRLLEAPASAVTFLVDDGEAQAASAWRWLASRGVKNVYVVEGGVTRWLDLYPVPACVAEKAPGGEGGWRFDYAAGDALPSSWPELERSRSFRFPCATASLAEGDGEYRWPAHPFTKKVQLQTRSVVKGGCG
jgi:rhodanese-related sulfurtransferase